jgi:hypothetical protein
MGNVPFCSRWIGLCWRSARRWRIVLRPWGPDADLVGAGTNMSEVVGRVVGGGDAAGGCCAPTTGLKR